MEVGGDELERDWREVIEACPWEAVPAQENQPDRFIYDIQAGERQATLPERELTGPWLRLVDMARRAAGQQSG